MQSFKILQRVCYYTTKKDAYLKELSKEKDAVINRKDIELKELSKEKDAYLKQKDIELKELNEKRAIELKELNAEIRQLDNKKNELDSSAKALATECMLLKGEISIRGALESAMFKLSPEIKGVQKQIDVYVKTDDFKKEYQVVCKKLNCRPDTMISSYLYSAISTYHHSGAYPIQCHTSKNFLSLTQWAMLITLFKLGHKRGAFDVYDQMERLIDVYE
ncbi:hypothetical protein HDV04_002032 [Boothiomyces sp. JEL0838]|nr:hypothetical protein HDV04_002032 [Boothiomyces sp. JEL0838]